MTSPAADGERAVTTCFGVSIDGDDLGTFTSCEGLGCEIVLEQREEGGSNGFVWQLPTRIKYTNITLSRPVGKDTAGLAKWISDIVAGVQPRTMSISARTAENKVVAQWDLLGVVPVRWKGPSLNVDSPKVAVETIELAHHGIVPVAP